MIFFSAGQVDCYLQIAQWVTMITVNCTVRRDACDSHQILPLCGFPLVSDFLNIVTLFRTQLFCFLEHL